MSDDPTRTVVPLPAVGAADLDLIGKALGFAVIARAGLLRGSRSSPGIATRIIQDGRRITVDGEAGVVLIG